MLRIFIVLFYALTISLFYCFLNINQFWETLFSSPNQTDENFDYIIVGAGSAGSIVADKLSKTHKVLLLEAGHNSINLFHIPSLGLLLQKSNYDWSYQTVPQQQACYGLENNASLWPMGKLIGGTMMLNNLIYVRPHREDLEEWFHNSRDMYKYVEEFEKRLKVSDLRFSSILPDILLKAAKELNYDIHQSTSSNNLTGFMQPKLNLDNGQRWTTANKLDQNNPNLFIRTNSHVEKVLFKSNYEAHGVQYRRFGQTVQVFAKQAVILSAGVIGTPKILMLSGVGPKDHLNSLNIPLVGDLPVGNNLQDHVATGLDLVLFNQSLGIGLENILSPWSAAEYFLNGNGPWTTAGCEVIGLLNTENRTAKTSRPDLQFMIMPLGVAVDNGFYLRKLIGISNTVWTNYFSKIDKNSATFLPVVLHPKSVGTVRLQSKDPNLDPIIDPKYLSHPYDVQILIEGIAIIKRLIRTKPFQAIGAELNKNVFPGCEMHKFDTRSYWECYVRHLTLTSYHPVGTCKMGYHNDSTAVVDFNFQVKNLNKLYIVDGSVLPSQSSGNINAPILMLAELASDIIKKQFYLSQKACSLFDLFIPNKPC